MPVFVDVDQNSEEWFGHRCGIPTSSAFPMMMAKGQGKTRRTYLLKLAGEVITGRPAENFSNAYMDRGHDQEPEARALYEFQTETRVQVCGFVLRDDGRAGASPDSMIGDDGILEIKTKMPHLLIEWFLKDTFPSEHVWQCQGQMWVADRAYVDLIGYCPDMPPFIKRLHRCENKIAELEAELDRFHNDLDDIVNKVLKHG